MSPRKNPDPSQVPSTLQLGKGGVTPTWLEELHEQAENRGMVKVKLLPASRQGGAVKELAAKIAEDARVRLVEVRGFTATFARTRGRLDRV